MSWRKIQLGDTLCDQDKILLDIVNDRAVKIHNNQKDYIKQLRIDINADFLIILFTKPSWLSEIQSQLDDAIDENINNLYLGINRYIILGNDTAINYDNEITIGHGQKLLNVLELFVQKQGFCIKRQRTLDQDQGEHFNFVQPLTWLYAERETNRSH